MIKSTKKENSVQGLYLSPSVISIKGENKSKKRVRRGIQHKSIEKRSKETRFDDILQKIEFSRQRQEVHYTDLLQGGSQERISQVSKE